MARISILGGGVGGVVTANVLRGLLPAEHPITLVEKNENFNLGAAKTWVMMGHKTLQEVSRPLAALKAKRIDVRKASAVAIADHGLRTMTSDGSEAVGDYAVIALGADVNLGAIPGLEGAAQTFYTLDGAIKLGEVLKGFQGGSIVILNPKMPIKCPPAPYEIAFLLHHEFKTRGILDKSKLSLCTVEPFPMPTAGAKVGVIVKEELAKRGIGYFPQKNIKSVDGARKTIFFEDGEVAYDLLIAVPPHEAPKVLRDTGLLSPSGWIPVDPKTLRTQFENVYAIGDVTTLPLPGRHKPDVPLALPKAAVFAEAQGKVVAEQIAAKILGRAPKAEFDGKGFCYVEMGERHAMGGNGSFFETPAPVVDPGAPDLHQYEAKEKWAREFLERYF